MPGDTRSFGNGASHAGREPSVTSAWKINRAEPKICRCHKCLHFCLSSLPSRPADCVGVCTESRNPCLLACNIHLCEAITSQNPTPSDRVLLIADPHAKELCTRLN